jgi:hypothetical protein
MTRPIPLDEQITDIRNTVLFIADALGAALPHTAGVLTGLQKLADTATSCKHCGEWLVKNGNDWYHAAGDQQGKHRCALDPYGFNAAPMGTPCRAGVNACNCTRGIEPRPE